MTRFFGYLGMKLSMRRHGDPIGDALRGAPNTDPSVVAFVESLQRAAGREESIPASSPMDAIVDAVAAGSNPVYGDLPPVVSQRPGGRFVRWATTLGLAGKMLFGAAALAAVTTTAAATGTLPGPVQDFFADAADNVGIELPHSDTTTAPSGNLPDPASPVPGGPIDHRDAVRSYDECVQTARSEYLEANGNAAGFDASESCGERPDPKDFPRPDTPANGEDSPSETRPPATGDPGRSGQTPPTSQSPSETRPTQPPRP